MNSTNERIIDGEFIYNVNNVGQVYVYKIIDGSEVFQGYVDKYDGTMGFAGKAMKTQIQKAYALIDIEDI